MICGLLKFGANVIDTVTFGVSSNVTDPVLKIIGCESSDYCDDCLNYKEECDCK